ncbi:acyloxyacyl hydrolase [Geoalkalibacter halelectricus]|nr:acyloxyacyl hydrolase [Geoalkalibacter halelectricus]
MLCPLPVAAAQELVPTRFGLGGNLGSVYDPNEKIDFVQVVGLALFDYDAVWPHRAPEALRFKVEANLGLTTAPKMRVIASGNMLALYFLDRLRSSRLRPYAEAGIGLIYTDFQVDGQGLRINFNPQAGIGTEIETNRYGVWFTAFRLHHVSNADLHRDNRGINSVVLSFGRFF